MWQVVPLWRSHVKALARHGRGCHDLISSSHIQTKAVPLTLFPGHHPWFGDSSSKCSPNNKASSFVHAQSRPRTTDDLLRLCPRQLTRISAPPHSAAHDATRRIRNLAPSFTCLHLCRNPCRRPIPKCPNGVKRSSLSCGTIMMHAAASA